METLTPGNVAPEQPSPSGSTFPYVIDCAEAIQAQLAASALDGLCRLRHGGLEIGGVLYGGREPGRITIQAVRELECEHALGPAFRLSNADWDRLSEMMLLPASDPEMDGLEVVGWYVSHTRCGLELTPNDVELFTRVFTGAAHFALVLNPSQSKPARAGYFARGSDGTLATNTPFVEFCIEQKSQDSEPAETRAEETFAASEPQPPAEELELSTEEPQLAEPRPKGGKLAFALLAAIGLAIGAAATWIYLVRTPAGEPQAPVNTPPPTQITVPVDAPATPQQLTAPPAQPIAEVHESVAGTPASSQSARPLEAGRDSQQDRVKQLEQELATLRARLNQPGQRAPSAGPAAARTEAAQRTEISLTPPPVDHVDPGVVSDIAARLSAQPPVAPPPAAPAATNLTSAANRVTPPAQPRAGRIIWTGLLHKGSVLFIEDKRCSSGAFTGALPGIPVRLHASAAELTDSGMIVYSSDSKQTRTSEAPGSQNGWNYTAYTYDPRRARDLRLLEAPGAQNAWKKLVIRSEARSTSIVVIDWESLSGR